MLTRRALPQLGSACEYVLLSAMIKQDEEDEVLFGKLRDRHHPPYFWRAALESNDEMMMMQVDDDG